MPNIGDDYITTFLTNCGGVSNTLPDELIADNELADARNIMPALTSGNLIDRAGTKSHLSIPTGFPTVVNSIYQGLNGSYLTENYASGPIGYTRIRDLATGTQLYNGVATSGADYPGSWASMQGADIYSDRYFTFKTTNGTTFTTFTGPPAGTNIIAEYNNMMFGAAVNGTTFQWSSVGDYNTWPVTNAYTLNRMRANMGITALTKFGVYLVVWCRGSYHLVQGFSPLDVTIVYSNMSFGASNKNMTLVTPYGLIWWNDTQGVCFSPDGREIRTPMMQKLKSTFFDVNNFTPIYGTAIWRPDYQCASFYVPTNTGAALTYANLMGAELRIDYFPLTNSFYLHSGSGVLAWTASCNSAYASNFAYGANPVQYTNTVYLGQRSMGGTVVIVEDETEVADYDQLRISYMKTKRKYEGTPNTIKRCRAVNITTKTGTVADLQYAYIADNALSPADTRVFTAEAGVSDTNIGVTTELRKMQHQIWGPVGQRVEYYSLVEVGTIEKVL